MSYIHFKKTKLLNLSCFVKCYRKSYLQDIAIATGATFVAEEVGITLDSVTLDMLGTAERIVIQKELTTIVTDGKQEQAVKVSEF